MSVWQSGDTLDSMTLNARMASASSTAGFSTNTLSPESGNTISVTSASLAVSAGLQAVTQALGVGGSAPSSFIGLKVTGTIPGDGINSPICLLQNATITAAQTNEVLYGIKVRNITSPGAFTGVQARGLHIQDVISANLTNYAAIEIVALSGATTNNYGILIGNVTGNGAFAINTGLGTVAFGDLLDVSASTIRLRTSGTPTGTGSGNTGDIKWDTSYIYVCTSVNSWSRATLNKF